MLTKQELLHKIGTLLEELQEQYTYLKDEDQGANDLDFELFEANASYFVSHASLLQKLSTAHSIDFTPATPVAEEKMVVEDEKDEAEEEITWGEPEKEDEEESEVEEPEEEEPETAVVYPVQEPEVQSFPQEEYAIAEEPEEEPVVEEPVVEEPVVEEPVVEEPVVEEPVFEKPVVEEPIIQEVTIEEKYFHIPDEPVAKPAVVPEPVIPEPVIPEASERPLTLNERLSNQHQPTPQRITDLKSSISLNDKLLFIRDLFNGYSLAYSEAIELLNRYDNFADADRFLQVNYAQKNNWESKQASVEKLYAILRRKFI
ncbi:hypothetical protein SAMN05216436_105148 [bacterium A37T11]|nr:hypothetical protein SAMN05216436_105148 [bacterium A37T11]